MTVASREDRDKPNTGSFDALQGLVIGVDTKDRYTKRHSEDVARYAVFLARQFGLDEEMLDMIHLAGLLHDVGKVGIPDALLRKPGKLTADEYRVFQQHVALGGAIVRDVPHVDLVRSGIKHHHERWDGQGYLEGLEGEGIPIIGRVLAVAHAFSAMTTTRPYRKALSIEEALKRLGDAAGTQLQEELVTSFITGIETAADAPMDGARDGGRRARRVRRSGIRAAPLDPGRDPLDCGGGDPDDLHADGDERGPPDRARLPGGRSSGELHHLGRDGGKRLERR